MNSMTFASNSNNVPPRTLKIQRKKMKDSSSSKKSQDLTVEQVLEHLLEKVHQLEAEVESLKKPQLMYKRPGSEQYEKITEFFDDVEIRLKQLES
jgi:hypothetical protein